MKMKAYEEVSPEVIATLTEDTVISTKIDGEFTLCAWKREGIKSRKRGKTGMSPTSEKALFANRVTMRWELPCLKEVEKIMEKSKYNSVVLMGELVVKGSKGEILRSGPARAFTEATEKDPRSIKYWIFDIFYLDDLLVEGPYWSRMAMVDKIFKGADKELVEPVYWVKAGTDPKELAEDIWTHRILAKGLEGVVVRDATRGILKIKPRHTVDLGVIGVQPGTGKHEGRLGAVVCCFMDEEEDLRYSCRPGSGFTDKERESWWRWAMSNKVGESYIGDKKIFFVKPERVIQVKYQEVLFSPSMCFKWTGKEYERQPYEKRVPKLQKPTLAGDEAEFWRKDKSFNPKDLRMDQVPDWHDVTYKKVESMKDVKREITDKAVRSKEAMRRKLFGSTETPRPSGEEPTKKEIQKYKVGGHTITFYPEPIESVPWSKFGFTCSCPEWLLKGKCKHIQEIKK